MTNTVTKNGTLKYHCPSYCLVQASRPSFIGYQI